MAGDTLLLRGHRYHSCWHGTSKSFYHGCSISILNLPADMSLISLLDGRPLRVVFCIVTHFAQQKTPAPPLPHQVALQHGSASESDTVSTTRSSSTRFGSHTVALYDYASFVASIDRMGYLFSPRRRVVGRAMPKSGRRWDNALQGK